MRLVVSIVLLELFYIQSYGKASLQNHVFLGIIMHVTERM